MHLEDVCSECRMYVVLLLRSRVVRVTSLVGLFLALAFLLCVCRWFSFWVFRLGLSRRFASSVLNNGCRRDSVRFPSILVSLALLAIILSELCFSLILYSVDHLLVRLSTLVLSAVSILIVESHFV